MKTGVLSICVAVIVVVAASAAPADVHGNDCCIEELGVLRGNLYVNQHEYGPPPGENCVYTYEIFRMLWRFWEPIGCTGSEHLAPFSCAACGHTHATARDCGTFQISCEVERGHVCGDPGFHTGTAEPCHKTCAACSAQHEFCESEAPSHTGEPEVQQ